MRVAGHSRGSNPRGARCCARRLRPCPRRLPTAGIGRGRDGIEMVGAKGQGDLRELGPVQAPVHFDRHLRRAGLAARQPRQRDHADVLVPGRGLVGRHDARQRRDANRVRMLRQPAARIGQQRLCPLRHRVDHGQARRREAGSHRCAQRRAHIVDQIDRHLGDSPSGPPPPSAGAPRRDGPSRRAPGPRGPPARRPPPAVRRRPRADAVPAAAPPPACPASRAAGLPPPRPARCHRQPRPPPSSRARAGRSRCRRPACRAEHSSARIPRLRMSLLALRLRSRSLHPLHPFDDALGQRQRGAALLAGHRRRPPVANAATKSSSSRFSGSSRATSSLPPSIPGTARPAAPAATSPTSCAA